MSININILNIQSSFQHKSQNTHAIQENRENSLSDRQGHRTESIVKSRNQAFIFIKVMFVDKIKIWIDRIHYNTNTDWATRNRSV